MDDNNFGGYSSGEREFHSESNHVSESGTAGRPPDPYANEVNNDPFLSSTFSQSSNAVNPAQTGYTYVTEDEPNIVLGVIGAVIGSIPGCILWFVIAHFNFIAGIAGLAIMIGSIKGSAFLGRGLTKISVFLCIVVTCVMIFATNYFDYALQISDAFREYGYEVSVFDAFEFMPEFFKEYPQMAAGFGFNMIIGYVLTAVSSFRTVKEYL